MYTEYLIIEKHSRKELEDMVNKQLAAGFVPLGGVAVVYCKDEGYPTEQRFIYHQAVARLLDANDE